MTSEGQALKTSEFLRRRKLRLQQVREQSKDVAKKIRQRAKVEQLLLAGELDEKKEKNYLLHQQKIVKKLEELYAKGLDSVGTSHEHASDLRQPGQDKRQENLSHLRGKEAAAEQRKRKQQKLDEQKKVLERKVQAREAANVISREKSSNAVTKLTTREDVNKGSKDQQTITGVDICEDNSNAAPSVVPRNDMATQWDGEILTNEWESNIPTLDVPKDDKATTCNIKDDRIDKNRKRLNLFALSDEMPSSLRGGLSIPEELTPRKPSLTLVSEYIQNRGLRLREIDIGMSNKKHSEDLQAIRQTLIQSRASKPEGTTFNNICHVIEGQMIPVPTWRAEPKCEFRTSNDLGCKQYLNYAKEYPNCMNSKMNKMSTDINPVHPDTCHSSTMRRTTPVKLNTYVVNSLKTDLTKTMRTDKSLRNDGGQGSSLTKKKSVTMYNHSTKDLRDVVCTEQMVVRDTPSEHHSDAYCQALNKTAIDHDKEKQQSHSQETLNRVAVTRQNVEKEYKDTMAFLNDLSKNKTSKPIHNAYKDDHRQQNQRECRQRTLQREFKRITKEYIQPSTSTHKPKCASHERNIGNISKSPPNSNVGNNCNNKDFQYSWMPVPESDGNLAVHTIPTTVREGKSGNSVKFCKVDSYHEYRSRHKHTPPTKDTNIDNKKSGKRIVEAVIIQQKHDNVSASLSASSEDSSTGDLNSVVKKNTDEETDAERIIIYKIMDYKNRKIEKSKAKSKSTQNVNNYVHHSTGTRNIENTNNMNSPDTPENVESCVSNFEEGKSKTVNERGDNIASHYSSNYCECDGNNSMKKDNSQNHCNRGDNVEDQQNQGVNSSEIQHEGTASTQDDRNRPKCKCGSKFMKSKNLPGIIPSAATSNSSFKTVTSENATAAPPQGRYMQLLNEGDHESGNFYIGATGFLKDDAYEVVIQLRKKESNKEESEQLETKIIDEQPHLSKKSNCQAHISTIDTKNNIEEDIVHKSKDVANAPDVILPEPTREDLMDANHSVICEGSNNELGKHLTSCDKGVSTSFQDIFSVPIHIPKHDPGPRPTTSICTQTTLSTPNSRPVLIHMSSSTSTAYMSPPETLLPKYFQSVYEPCVIDNSEWPKQYDHKNEICRCNRCARAFKGYQKKMPAVSIKKHFKTPPNTARSLDSDMEMGSGHDDVGKIYRTSRHSSPVMRTHNRNCYKSKTGLKVCCRAHSIRNSHQFAINLRNSSIRDSTSNSPFSKRVNKVAPLFKYTNKLRLSPVLKDYVNKLLSLNRDGVKTVQILNQECSTVTTPASSIINHPSNIPSSTDTTTKDGKITLDQIKIILKQQLLEDIVKRQNDIKTTDNGNKEENNTHMYHHHRKNIKLYQYRKKKAVHKVKSLNISKRVLKGNTLKLTSCDNARKYSTSCIKEGSEKIMKSVNPKQSQKHTNSGRTIEMEVLKTDQSIDGNKIRKARTTQRNMHLLHERLPGRKCNKQDVSSTRKDTMSTQSTSLDSNCQSDIIKDCVDRPINTATQTSRIIDSDINLEKIAKDKLQNMEKIADLTEKCTKRLSNLAKVLEEVRRNKSFVYGQTSRSDSVSDSDQDKNMSGLKLDSQNSNDMFKVRAEENSGLASPLSVTLRADEGKQESTSYTSLLSGISKPMISKPTFDVHLDEDLYRNNVSNYPKHDPTIPETKDDQYHSSSKSRSRPPPALLRINIKHSQDNIVPHELSTVIEVDSPMSVKLKNQSSHGHNSEKLTIDCGESKQPINPDLLQSNVSVSKHKLKTSSTESSEDSKLQMMDLNQFNEIMLQPFISIQEYTRGRYFNENTDSKHENFSRDNVVDDVSSLHSDGSLPDVVAELLKRNLISEPFKFDTVSNYNSTTVSSESTLSLLALSNVRKGKNKLKLSGNKENAAETTDTSSISSNPDLENAFKKLGMGWASSTLKKTKERLALSSSTNTSSSSLNQFKFRNKNDAPTIVIDSVTSLPNLGNNKIDKDKRKDLSKNAEQQTSLTNSMTVKEFLANELAKKITFTNKSGRNETNEEFVSLFETKMPDELKKSSLTVIEPNSGDSIQSVNNNRARTSTPVQFFKSMTYHSSSSSNKSNGLFSNADDLSSVKLTSTSMRNNSTSEKDDLTIPNYSLKIRRSLSNSSNKTDSC